MRNELSRLALELGVADSFIFTGVVHYDRVPLYINASDLCVAPFIVARNAKIGLSPLKLYEYMACGKPVVAAAIGGVTDLLEASKGGIPVPPEDPDALARAVLKLLLDEDLRQCTGCRGSQYVMKNHSWCRVEKRVEEICRTGSAD